MSNTQSGTEPNKTTAKELDQMAIAGIQKYFANVPKITLAGTDYTAATLSSALQGEVNAITALDGAKSQLKQQVATTQTVRAGARSLRALVRKYILTTYGAQALQMLGDFGMTAPKNLGPRTVAAKAEAQAKAKVTRLAKKNALNNATSAPAATVAAAVSTTPAKQ
jgi:hypothetical protein